MHWSGYTAGYQGKRIDNTSVRDEPYKFTLGANQVRLHRMITLPPTCMLCNTACPALMFWYTSAMSVAMLGMRCCAPCIFFSRLGFTAAAVRSAWFARCGSSNASCKLYGFVGVQCKLSRCADLLP